MSDLSDLQAAQSVKLVSANPSTGVETAFVTLEPTPTNGVVTGGLSASGYSPDPSAIVDGTTADKLVDPGGNQQFRGQVLTDEASFRTDFSSTDFPGGTLPVTLTGTLTFTNGSTAVTATGSLFTSELKVGTYIKASGHSETVYNQVEAINSDTSLTLSATYAGATVTSAAVKSPYITTTGTGSISIASSQLSLSASTVNANTTRIYRAGDYLPCNRQFRASVSQRIANQTTTIGFQSSPTSPVYRAVVIFDGTVNTTVKFQTSNGTAAADTETTTVTLPDSLTTATLQNYEIDVTGDQASLLINKIIVATNLIHLPDPYAPLSLVAVMTNSAVVTATTLVIENDWFSNFDRVQVSSDTPSDPLPAIIRGRVYGGQTQEVGVSKSYSMQTVNQPAVFAERGILYYTTTTLVSLASTAETPLFYIRNQPNTNLKNVILSRMSFIVPSNNAHQATYRVYMNPTITANGTGLSTVNARQTGLVTALASVFRQPTATSNGTQWCTFVCTSASEHWDINGALIIEPGNTLLVTAAQSNNAAVCAVNCAWYEQVINP